MKDLEQLKRQFLEYVARLLGGSAEEAEDK